MRICKYFSFRDETSFPRMVPGIENQGAIVHLACRSYSSLVPSAGRRVGEAVAIDSDRKLSGESSAKSQEGGEEEETEGEAAEGFA